MSLRINVLGDLFLIGNDKSFLACKREDIVDLDIVELAKTHSLVEIKEIIERHKDQ